TISIFSEKAKGINVQNILKKLRTISLGSLKSLAFDGEIKGPPVGQALFVTFRSNNMEKLLLFTKEFKEEISKVDGIVDIADDNEVGKLEYELELDYEMMARLKLNTEEVGFSLRTALQGAIASELNIDNKEIDLRIRYSDENKATIDALKNTKIMEPSGNLIPLTEVGKIKQVVGPGSRIHLDYLRAINVSANVVPEKITSIKANKMAEKIFNDLSK